MDRLCNGCIMEKMEYKWMDYGMGSIMEWIDYGIGGLWNG